MKIKIVALSDAMRNIKDGDYWVKKDLEAEFAKRGYEIVDSRADLDLDCIPLLITCRHLEDFVGYTHIRI